jgi:hypothetical protein
VIRVTGLRETSHHPHARPLEKADLTGRIQKDSIGPNWFPPGAWLRYDAQFKPRANHE